MSSSTIRIKLLNYNIIISECNKIKKIEMETKVAQGQTVEKDWKKFVTLNPPNAVIFKESKEDGKGTS